jgi:signal peptidase II
MLKGFSLIFFCCFLDQFTKFYAKDMIEVATLFDFKILSVNLSFVLNKGVSFGFFSDAPNIRIHLVLLDAVILLFVGHELIKTKFANDICIVFAGGLSNFLDRIILAGVVDFIEIRFFDHSLFVCNIADIVISLGCAWYVLKMIKKNSKVSTKNS